MKTLYNINTTPLIPHNGTIHNPIIQPTNKEKASNTGLYDSLGGLVI